MNLGMVPMLSTLLALAAYVIGLALFAQVFQELYKFLSSSKARAYQKVLVDFAGPWARQLMRPEALPDMTVRGPFQVRRLSPRGKLLPLEGETLTAAAERTAPAWVKRALDALALEVKLQGGEAAAPSPSWQGLVEQLTEASPGSPGYRSARRVLDVLERWGAVKSGTAKAARTLDARRLQEALRRELLPHVVSLEEGSEQLERNFTYAYRRRNLRQTFTIAMLIAVVFNLPFDRLFKQAAAMPPEAALAAAEAATTQWEQSMAAEAPTSDKAQEPAQRAQALVGRALEVLEASQAPVNYLIDGKQLRELTGRPWLGLRYLFGCLVTALMVTFGAPVLTDLTSLLLRLQRGRSSAADTGG